MPYAQVNGQNLYFEDSGGAGPALIFSHGLLMDSSMFAPQGGRAQVPLPLHRVG